MLDRIKGDFSLPADIAARGVSAQDLPGQYMYRDIGLKYWDAIYSWVHEYLSVSQYKTACTKDEGEATRPAESWCRKDEPIVDFSIVYRVQSNLYEDALQSIPTHDDP